MCLQRSPDAKHAILADDVLTLHPITETLSCKGGKFRDTAATLEADSSESC